MRSPLPSKKNIIPSRPIQFKVFKKILCLYRTKRSELQIESDQLDQMLKQMASKNEIRFRLDHAQKELAVKKQLERRLMVKALL